VLLTTHRYEPSGNAENRQAIMTEREPRPIEFYIDIGDKHLICTPENTKAYMHENPKHDYLFYIVEQDDDIMRGHHIFRCMLKEQFDVIIGRMARYNYDIIDEDGLVGADLEAYYLQYPDELKLDTYEITPRQQHHIDFLHYLLEHDLMEVEDFEGEGELPL
jgi:hypothetical protein